METERHRGSIAQYRIALISLFGLLVLSMTTNLLQQSHIASQEPILQFQPIYQTDEVLRVYNNKVTPEFAKFWAYTAGRLITDVDPSNNVAVDLRYMEILFTPSAYQQAKSFLFDLHSLKQLEGIGFHFEAISVRVEPDERVSYIGQYTFDNENMLEPVIKRFKFTFTIAAEKYLPRVTRFEWSEVQFK